MSKNLYHHGVKGMKWGVRKKRTGNANRKKHNTNEKYKALGYMAAGVAISALGATIASSPTIRNLAYKGIQAASSSKVDISDMGPVILDKFGNIVNIDI